jgi:hypothetical protein
LRRAGALQEPSMTQCTLELEARPPVAAPAPAAPAAGGALADCRVAIACARQADASADGLAEGRDAAAWWRLALLRSFVTALPHDEAAALPLRVLPPPGLAPVNPVQALQAAITRVLAQAQGLRRLQRLAARLPDEARRLAFHRFVSLLLPRLIEARGNGAAGPSTRALESAWADARVQRGWWRFASRLAAPEAALLARRLAADGAGSGDNGRPCEERARWPSTSSRNMRRSSGRMSGSPTARP